MIFRNYLASIYKLNKVSYFSNLFKHYSIFKEHRAQLKSQKQPLELELPWITIDAKRYIDKYISNKKDIKVFEFGSGGSSLYFLNKGAKTYTVEHDYNWFQKVKNIIQKRDYAQNWQGNLIEAEPIASNITLSKANPSHYYSDDINFRDKNFKRYVSHIDQFDDSYFDLILIDGRARPSCIKHSVSKIKENGLLVIDNSERLYYYEQTLGFLKNYILVTSSYSALIGTNSLTQTNIYKKCSND